jgi:hypothetical protein
MNTFGLSYISSGNHIEIPPKTLEQIGSMGRLGFRCTLI